MDRKKNRRELEDLLIRVVSKITERFVVDEVLLYGSYAKASANAYSDIDLAIISPDLKHKSIYANNRFIKTQTQLYEADLQLRSFASSTFYNEDFVDPVFVQEIKRTGKQIYTKARGIDFSCLET